MPKENNNRKRLFLIDGYAMLYRAHFAFIRAPLITTDGLHTSALFGFSSQVLNLLKNEEPDYIAAVFDTDKKTFRHKLYEDYKATREKMPEEMRSQLPFLWQILESMNITTLSKVGFEADDIIGTLAKDAAELGLDVYIVSGDKDFMQLVNDHIFLYASADRGMEIKIYDKDGVKEKWGVPPEKIIDLLGLMGDSSDNVPGVRGVGEKSAVKLIKEYGSLEKALDNAEQVTNKRVRTGLLDCKEEALLSKELVTIDTSVSLDSGIAALERKDFNLDTLADLFKKLEFSSLFSMIGQFQKMPEIEEFESPTKDYQTLLTLNKLNSFVSDCKKASLVSFDLETTSVDPMNAEIVGFSFSIKPNTGVYIPVRYSDKKKIHFGDDELAAVLKALRPVFESSEILKTGQNVKYDSLILKRHGIQVTGMIFDTMIAAHLINPASRSYKLDNLSKEYLNYKMVPIEDLIGSGRNQKLMEEVPLDKIAYYAAEDADVALQLTAIFKKRLKEDDLNKFFSRVEVPLIEVLRDMEMEGVYVDKNILKKMSIKLGGELEDSVKGIITEAGTEFNVNSTQQLAQILFDKLRKRYWSVCEINTRCRG
jgi:DNA polymerase-1